MELLLNLLGANWKTSVIGILSGIFGYLALMGPNLPVDLKGWGAALFAGLMISLGVSAKSNNVTNAPNPVEAAIVVAPVVASAKAAVPTRMMKG
jgi:hypothetical protein